MFDFQTVPLVHVQFGKCRKPRRLSPGDNFVFKCVTLATEVDSMINTWCTLSIFDL